MADGYFKRGEVYWVRMDTAFGYEQGVGRPGLILSNDAQNNASGCVTFAFCSKQQQHSWEVEIEATGCTSYVKLSQIQTVDKSRLGKCIGVLNSAEMRAVDDGLEEFFDLGYIDDAALKEKDKEIAERDGVIGVLRAEAAGTAAKIQEKDDEIASLKMEIEMWQKCYGRCMDMLVDTKVNGDLRRRVVEPKKPVEPKVGTAAALIPDIRPEPPKQPETPSEEPKLVDINSATFNQLRGIGLSNNVILTVIDKRPFAKVEDLKSLPGMNSQRYNIISKKICCVPVATPKSALVEKDPGYEVEETPVEPVAEVRKVNVNTASAKEISEVSGLNINACYAITGKRKRDGLFKSLDELVMPPRITEKMLAKCRDKLEV